MISVSKKVWSERKISQRLIDKFVQDYALSPILAKIIISKNFSLEEIYSIENKIYLKNVFKNNKDFISTCEIIENSIKNNDRIVKERTHTTKKDEEERGRYTSDSLES